MTHFRLSVIAATATATVFCMPRGTAAQSEVAEPQATRVVVLDPENATYGPPSQVLEHRGRFFVLDAFSTHELRVFDSDGSFVGAVGRDGQGPGEFRMIEMLLAGPGDSITILDQGNLRRVTLSPELRISREEGLPAAVRGRQAWLVDGDLVVASRAGRSGTLEGGIHRFPRGSEVPTWSADAESTGPDPRLPSTAYFAPRAVGGLWVLGTWDYALRVLNAETGALGSPRYFAEAWNEGLVRGGPPDMTLGMSEDGLGRLWVTVRRRDPPSGRRPLPPVEADAEQPVTPDFYSETFDIVLEVIDLDEGRIVGRLTNDAFPGGLLGPGRTLGSMRFWTYEPDAPWSVVVWEASLQS